MTPLQELLNGEEMMYPIKVIKHETFNVETNGCSRHSLYRKEMECMGGSQRIQAAIKLGYTHIEGIIANE
jgi:hypothetical protein